MGISVCLLHYRSCVLDTGQARRSAGHNITGVHAAHCAGEVDREHRMVGSITDKVYRVHDEQVVKIAARQVVRLSRETSKVTIDLIGCTCTI